MTIPTSEFRRAIAVAPRASFVWRARDLSLNALTGQVGTLVRAATGTSLDSYAVSLTTVRDRPRWHITSSLAAIKLGALEYLGWPVPMIPIAMSGLIDFIEDGTLAAGTEIMSIANAAAGNASFRVNSSGSFYRVVHNNNVSSVTSTLAAAPTAGQRVRLRWLILSTGSVQIFQSIDGAAETTAAASGILALATAWSATTTLFFNSFGASNYGVGIFMGAVVMPGNQTQATLLQALGY